MLNKLQVIFSFTLKFSKALLHQKLLSTFLNSDSNIIQTQIPTLKLIQNLTPTTQTLTLALILTHKKAIEKCASQYYSIRFRFTLFTLKFSNEIVTR